MFDLELAIADWRRQLGAAGVGLLVLDELEAHLRDDVEAQIVDGATAEEAFASGVERLGEAGMLHQEFAKLEWLAAGRDRVKHLFLTLAGVPGFTPNSISDPMNTITAPANASEPRWVSYSKAALFAVPAASLWVFAIVFLLPKLQQMSHMSGLSMPWIYQAMMFVADHSQAIFLAAAAAVILVEWRWSGWARYRRVALNGAAVLVNTAVLLLITVLAICALIAGPALAHHLQ
jgi:hypothetical protein